MTMYADYEFYRATYYGTAIDVDNFDRIMLNASALIDEITFNRIKSVTDDIKLAACAVADEMNGIEQAKAASSGGAVASEKTGDQSVSYNTSMTTEYSSDAYRRYYGIVTMYIRDKRLLERWCCY